MELDPQIQYHDAPHVQQGKPELGAVIQEYIPPEAECYTDMASLPANTTDINPADLQEAPTIESLLAMKAKLEQLQTTNPELYAQYKPYIDEIDRKLATLLEG